MFALFAGALLLAVFMIHVVCVAASIRSRQRGGNAKLSAARSTDPLNSAAALGTLIPLAAVGVLSTPAQALAQNVVVHWANVIAPAIHSAGAPRSPGSSEVLHAMAQLAVHDAVMAIEGGHPLYGGAISAAQGADVRAAVATAAYRTTRARVVTSQLPYLDWHYADYMAGIAHGAAKADGIAVGEAAAAALLAKRASDGFGNVVPYGCTSTPPAFAEFEPNGGCGTQPVDAKLAQVTPFTFSEPAAFRPDGPAAFDTTQWVRDFNETKRFGRADSAIRLPEQTDVAWFWSEHAYIHWNRNLNALAISRGLNVRDSARMLALVHTASADAIIAGFEAKYHHRFARPRSAIPRADEDGNPYTVAEPGWKPLLTVNHPEYPSAHAFWTGALAASLDRYFCTDDLPITLTTSQDTVPQVVKAQRRYKGPRHIARELADARVWAGLHWRDSMKDGDRLGARVAHHVMAYFGQYCNR